MKAFIGLVIVLAVLGALICGAMEEQPERSAALRHGSGLPAQGASLGAQEDEGPVELPAAAAPFLIVGTGAGLMLVLGGRHE